MLGMESHDKSLSSSIDEYQAITTLTDVLNISTALTDAEQQYSPHKGGTAVLADEYQAGTALTDAEQQ